MDQQTGQNKKLIDQNQDRVQKKVTMNTQQVNNTKMVELQNIEFRQTYKPVKSKNELFSAQHEDDLQLPSGYYHKLPADSNKGRKISKVLWNKSYKYTTQLLTIDEKGMLCIYEAKDKKLIKEIECSNDWLMSLDVDKQGQKIATGTLGGKILIYDINSTQANKLRNFGQDKAQAELLGHTGSIASTQFLSTNYVIAGSTDSTLSIWDLENPRSYLGLHQQHNGEILCLSIFEKDPNIFLSGSSDCTSKIWDIRVKNPVIHTFRGKESHDSSINTVKFLPASAPTTFATGSDDCTIILHDLRMSDPVGVFQDFESKNDAVQTIAFSQSGRLIFGGTEHHMLKIWDLLGCGNKVHYKDVGIQEGQGHIKSIDLSADGWAVAVSGTEPGELYYTY